MRRENADGAHPAGPVPKGREFGLHSECDGNQQGFWTVSVSKGELRSKLLFLETPWVPYGEQIGGRTKEGSRETVPAVQATENNGLNWVVAVENWMEVMDAGYGPKLKPTGLANNGDVGRKRQKLQMRFVA